MDLYKHQGPDCVLHIDPITFVDKTRANYPSLNNGRFLFYAIDDQRKWEGYWVEDIEGGGCAAGKKDGSHYWGAITLRFNETYTQWKGDFDFCGTGRRFPWDGFRK